MEFLINEFTTDKNNGKMRKKTEKTKKTKLQFYFSRMILIWWLLTSYSILIRMKCILAVQFQYMNSTAIAHIHVCRSQHTSVNIYRKFMCRCLSLTHTTNRIFHLAQKYQLAFVRIKSVHKLQEIWLQIRWYSYLFNKNWKNHSQITIKSQLKVQY